MRNNSFFQINKKINKQIKKKSSIFKFKMLEHVFFYTVENNSPAFISPLKSYLHFQHLPKILTCNNYIKNKNNLLISYSRLLFEIWPKVMNLFKAIMSTRFNKEWFHAKWAAFKVKSIDKTVAYSISHLEFQITI